MDIQTTCDGAGRLEELRINGDLQVNAGDEACYHEGLLVPALAALLARVGHAPLDALILGGGDGLALKRILDVPTVRSVRLVDINAEVVELGRTALADLNAHAFEDPRVVVTIGDAWLEADVLLAEPLRYDLIVSDFTVPREVEATRLHSVDWYEKLFELLTVDGVVAVNGESPTAYPEAFFSIYNAMRAAGLSPHPYRVHIPSFEREGYGPDWGMVVAGRLPLDVHELARGLLHVPGRQIIRDTESLRRLFVFPQSVAAYRAEAAPIRVGSGLFLRYLSTRMDVPWGEGTWDALREPVDSASLPELATVDTILSPRQVTALAATGGMSPDEVARSLRELVPALHEDQTRPIIREILADPIRFLATVDVRGTLEALLARATELTADVVDELKVLLRLVAERVPTWDELVEAGPNIIMVLALAIIISTMAHPGAIYGKGVGGDGGSGAHAFSGESIGQTYRGSYNAGTDVSPVTGNAFRGSGIGTRYNTDETGAVYPRDYYAAPGWRVHSRGRTYYYQPRPGGYYVSSHTAPVSGTAAMTSTAEVNTIDIAYHLTDDAQVLTNGHIAVSVSPDAYLDLGPSVSPLIDTKTGEVYAVLMTDQQARWRVLAELRRQRASLRAAAQGRTIYQTWTNWLAFEASGEAQTEIDNINRLGSLLARAEDLLGPLAAQRLDARPTQAPIAGAIQVFDGVWMTAAGDFILLVRPDGLVWMDSTGLYRGQGRTGRLDEPYPDGLKGVIAGALLAQIRNVNGTRSQLQAALADDQSNLDSLYRDLASYTDDENQNGPDYQDDYGDQTLPVSQCLALTRKDIAATKADMAAIHAKINGLPAIVESATRARAMLGFTGK